MSSSNSSLVINEIFFSIQGESSYVGRPCAFVRLTYCNLRCTYCDTEYAFYEGRKMSIGEILEALQAYPTELVELTGGEPLLQKGVHDLIRRLLDAGKTVLVETGGSLDVRPVDPRAVLIYDVKCPDSAMEHKNLLENLPRLRPQDEIKFVVGSRRDYEWATEKIRKFDLTAHHTVLFSPVWGKLEPRELAEWILEEGLPVRLQLQLHKLIWDPDRRGV